MIEIFTKNWKYNLPILGLGYIICALLGGFGIPPLLNIINDAQNDLITTNVQSVNNQLVFEISSNISALNNYLSTVGDAFDTYYGLNISIDPYQVAAAQPVLNSAFDISVISTGKILNSLVERIEFENKGKLLYNVSSFQIYNLINRQPHYIPYNYSFETRPLTGLFIQHPQGNAPGLPELGSANFETVFIDDIDILLNLENKKFLMSSLITILGVDQMTASFIILQHKHQNWLITAQFEPFLFLNIITNDVVVHKYFYYEISDGNLFQYASNTNKPQLSQFKNSQTVNFINNQWRVNLWATETFVDENTDISSDVILIASILILVLFALLFTLIIVTVNIFNVQNETLLQHEHNQKINMVHQSNNIMLHEVKNIAGTANAVLQFKTHKTLTVSNFQVINQAVKHICEIITNILDYEKLLSDDYEMEIEDVNIVEYTKHIITSYESINVILCTDLKNVHLCIDKLKFYEILMNVLNNVAKHATLDSNIYFNLQLVETDYVYVEIINEYICENNTEMIMDDIFVPFFMKTNEKLWNHTLDFLKTNNTTFIRDDFDTYCLKNTFSHHIIHRAKNKENVFHLKSSKLGLSICKLISKALGGDCGVYSFQEDGKHKVKFWCAIKHVPSTNSDLNV